MTTVNINNMDSQLNLTNRQISIIAFEGAELDTSDPSFMNRLSVRVQDIIYKSNESGQKLDFGYIVRRCVFLSKN